MAETVPPPEPLARPDAPGSFVPTLLDRLRARWADPRFGVSVLAIVAVAAGFLWYRAGSGRADAPGEAAVATTVPVAEPTTTTDDGPSQLVIHVAGAVVEPGVVRVPSSARVGDAIEAAGGAAPDAELDRLNLAAPLEDGQRVLVARVGDPPSAPLPESSVGGGGGGGADEDGPVDINAATAKDLEELPGIGPVLAQAIVDERERRGGFRSVNELRDVRGIGEARFADLKDRVRV